MLWSSAFQSPWTDPGQSTYHNNNWLVYHAWTGRMKLCTNGMRVSNWGRFVLVGKYFIHMCVCSEIASDRSLRSTFNIQHSTLWVDAVVLDARRLDYDVPADGLCRCQQARSHKDFLQKHPRGKQTRWNQVREKHAFNTGPSIDQGTAQWESTFHANKPLSAKNLFLYSASKSIHFSFPFYVCM